jgi:hypothetical protein
MNQNYILFKNFVSEQECNELSEWIIKNQPTLMFAKSKHVGTVRKTTRFSKHIVYPSLCFDLQNKIDLIIKDTFGLNEVTRVPNYPHGMYASYAKIGDACGEHTDSRWLPNHITYHFNIMITSYENADLFIEGKLIPIQKTDGILYPVSEVLHYTSELTGINPRMFWCFGYCIPLQNTSFSI